jgi:hypothetical protein
VVRRSNGQRTQAGISQARRYRTERSVPVLICDTYRVAHRGKRRFQEWLERRDRSNQATMDASRPPPVPETPAVVLQALTSIPDPAFAFRLRVVIDGKPVDAVPWGWSVHPLPLGAHTLELFHRSRSFPKASKAKVPVTLDEARPVMHVVYSATALGIRGGRVNVAPYDCVGGATSDDKGGAHST